MENLRDDILASKKTTVFYSQIQISQVQPCLPSRMSVCPEIGNDKQIDDKEADTKAKPIAVSL